MKKTLVLFILVTTFFSHAATLYWSGDGVTQGGAGPWNTAAAHWSTAATGPFTTVWNNANSDNPTFVGTGSTVTIGTSITQKGTMTVNTASYTFESTSNILTFNSGSALNVPTSISTTITARYAGTITKIGAGTLALNNTNSSLTKIILSGGRVDFSSPDHFGTGADASDFITFNGGTLFFGTTLIWTNGKSITVNSSGGTWTGQSNVTVTCDKPISGSGTLNLSAMNFILATNNPFTGTINLSSGSLYILGNIGSTNININGGTLGGTVTLAQQPNIAANGSISAGAPIGTLTLANGLNLSAGGTNLWELNTLTESSNGVAGVDFDQLLISGGSLVLAGNSRLLISFSNPANAPDAGATFWNSNHKWSNIIKIAGGTNSGSGNFFSVHPTSSAGTFFTTIETDGSVSLNYTANVSSSAPKLSLQVTNQIATLSWNSLIGRAYNVQIKTDPSFTNWTDISSNLPAIATNTSITNSISGTNNLLYRVLLLP